MIKAVALATIMATSIYLQPKYEPLIPIEPTPLGEFRITYYCECPICCGQYSGMHKTASGATPTPGVTVAAGSNIPFGTELVIDGHVYTVQDRGGAIGSNNIDILCASHSEALAAGTYYTTVYSVE